MIYQIISECTNLEQKEYTNKHDWLGKVNLDLNLNLTIRSGRWDVQTSKRFLDTNESTYHGHTTRPSESQQKRIYWVKYFVVLLDNKIKL